MTSGLDNEMHDETIREELSHGPVIFLDPGDKSGEKLARAVNHGLERGHIESVERSPSPFDRYYGEMYRLTSEGRTYFGRDF